MINLKKDSCGIGFIEVMTAKHLQDLRGDSKNSFKADPPNAVLSGNGQDAIIIIIESMTIDQGLIIYRLVYNQ